MTKNINNFIKNIGPGILMASAGIGMSHLIQSTRAGAYFGFELLWVIIAVNIIKYPFIEYGFRYCAAKKENLLQGYKNLNPKLLAIFLIINLISAIGTIAAGAYISAGILESIIKTGLGLKILSTYIIIICIFIIAIGSYRYFDNFMKIFMIILLISTTSVAALALWQYPEIKNQTSFYQDSPWSWQYLPFIIALMGWMPAPIEISVWHSIWLEEKNRNNKAIDFNSAKKDFNIGYFLMIITAILFLALGAIVMHHSGQEVSNSSILFSNQLILSYSSIIGDWSKNIISIAILATIFSTILVLIEAYPLSISKGLTILTSRQKNKKNSHFWAMFFCCFLSILLIHFFVNNFKDIVDIIATLAFISAPLFAYLNHKLVSDKNFPKEYKPKKWLIFLSYIGFSYMIIFCLFYLFS
jgi:Mn2+/Fe2+ NRAMP family transporter